MNSSTEKRFQRVQQNVKAGLSARMAERERAIIDRLLLEYRSGTINSEKLFGGIAAIAELRSIISEAERDYMQASDDAFSLTQNQLKD